jgi:hypothetical protein
MTSTARSRSKSVATPSLPAKPLSRLILEAYNEGESRGWNITWEPQKRDPRTRETLAVLLRARRDEWAALRFTDAHLAAITDDVALLERSELDVKPPDLDMMNGVDVQGWSLVEIAAGAGSVRVLDALLAKGNAVGKATKYAAQADRAAAVGRLLDHGADPFAALTAALGCKCRATVELVLPRCMFKDAGTERHELVAGALSADMPIELLDRMLAEGLDLNAQQDPQPSSSLAHNIGRDRSAPWLKLLVERGYRMTAQRVVDMLQELHEDDREPAGPLLEIALAQELDLDAEVSAKSNLESDPPRTLLDVALEQFSLAVAQRIAAAGAKPTERKVRKNWPEAKAKIAWLGEMAPAVTEQLRDKIGDLPKKKKSLRLDPENMFEPQADLVGIEACTNLTSLEAEAIQLADISALASLVKLKTLDLSANQIDDLAPLAGLVKLERLHLRGNPVQDIEPLATCKSLVWIDLRETHVGKRDIAALRKRGVHVVVDD